MIDGETRLAHIAVLLAAMLWLSFWFWAFSFAYSDSFFAYDRHSRLLAFVAALIGAVGIFASALVQWRARLAVLNACLRHAIGVAVALGPLVIVFAVFVWASRPWRLEADDALGVGINFMILFGVGAASVVGLAIALAVRQRLGQKGKFSPTLFVPEVTDIEKEESGVVGYFHIKFTLVDPSDPANRSYPVDYYGADLDFTSDKVRAELWKRYGFKFAQEIGE